MICKIMYVKLICLWNLNYNLKIEVVAVSNMWKNVLSLIYFLIGFC